MKVITNVSFLSLEFDFGEEGAISSEVFVEIDDDGDKSKLQHKVELQNVSFEEFLSEENIAELTVPGASFSTYIQNLRKLMTLKVASDLNLEVADLNYVTVESNREKIERLEGENELLQARDKALSERADFFEDVVAEMATQVYQ